MDSDEIEEINAKIIKWENYIAKLKKTIKPEFVSERSVKLTKEYIKELKDKLK